jgi:hypothetical protein
MLAVTVIVIITFISFWDPTLRRGGHLGGDSVGRVYDRSISLIDYQRGIRTFELCRDLGMQDLCPQSRDRRKVIGRGATQFSSSTISSCAMSVIRWVSMRPRMKASP